MLEVRDLARYLRVSTRTIYRRIKSGFIPRYYIQVTGGEFGKRGCTYRIYPEAINLFNAPAADAEHNDSIEYLKSKGVI